MSDIVAGAENLSFLRKLGLIRKAFVSSFWRRSYAQFGEDIALANFLDIRKPGFFVDVGSWHPKRFSNTYALYRRGWRGVNIDLDPDKIYCAQWVRPGDVNVVAAVTDVARRAKVYSDRAFSLGATIDPTHAGSAPALREVETTTLTEILDTTRYRDRPIDFLSVDVEGLDLSVLRGLDFARYRPAVIAIEAVAPDIAQILASDLHAFLTERGYRLANWVGLTLIYVGAKVTVSPPFKPNSP